MKSRYVSLRKNPAGSPENKKISYPGKGTRFGKHLFFTCLKIEYTLWRCFKQIQIIIRLFPHDAAHISYGMGTLNHKLHINSASQSMLM